jgi:colicin import membrane protein
MREFWARTRAFGLSLGVHLLAAMLVVLGTMEWRPFRAPRLEGLSIEAVIVDTSALRERREQARREAELAAQREAERQRRERELAAQRERDRQAALEAEREKARERREEELRLQQLRERQERERQERMERQQQELERIREQRERAERERRREEDRLKQLEARRQAEADAQRQAELEEQLRREQAAEQAAFRAGRLATLREQYMLAVQAQVTNNWLRPPTARPGLRCTLRIIQIPGGEVISANIAGRCNGDEATRRSLVAAVERAGALPYQGFEDVFEREIDFIFVYDGD